MQVDEEMAARCETVLNTTMAEMETYHSQKVEDFATVTKEHLDGEIEFYEQVAKFLWPLLAQASSCNLGYQQTSLRSTCV